MQKHHKFISFCLALFFVIVLQEFASPIPIFRFLAPAFVGYTGLVTCYNIWYLRRIEKYNFWAAIRPILFLLGAFGVFLNIPSPFFRSAFLVSCVLAISVFEIIIDSAAENVLLNETLVIAFALFFTLFAAEWYAPGYQSFYFLSMFLGTCILVRSFYELMPQSDKTKTVGAIIMGLFCSELYWALNFLHFHYSVLSVILFNLFYGCLIINYYYLFHVLNYKKIKFHMLLIAGCSVAVLLATPWTIIR